MNLREAIRTARIVLSEDPHYKITKEEKRKAYKVLADWHGSYDKLMEIVREQ